MTYSMTGYGAGKARAGKIIIDAEIKSVNGRGCDIRCNFPRELLALENDVRDVVKKQLSRGQITVFLNCSFGNDSSISIDEAQIKKSITQLKKIAKASGLSQEGNLDTLIRFLSNGNIVQKSFSVEKMRVPVMRAVSQAVKSNLLSREKEGCELIKDITSRVKNLHSKVTQIKKLAPLTVEAYTQRINRRLNQLKEQTGIEFDPVRVITETGVFAERVDITEEVIRLIAHIKTFQTTIKRGKVIGKRLDFLLQEMFRETTTIGNKCNNAKISSIVVTMKEELEKMREQAQNIV